MCEYGFPSEEDFTPGATVCAKGHVIDKFRADAAKACPYCGSQTFSRCGECGSPLPDGAGFPKYKPDFYCRECGTPYPWTDFLLDNAVELLALDDGLDADSKELIKSAIPDLIADSPATPVAASKYRKGLALAGDFLKNALFNLLNDALTEQAKRLIGL